MNLRTKLIDINLFIQNEYFDKYIDLICDNLDTEYDKFSTQYHHIIPRNFYYFLKKDVDNSKDNIVVLNYSDHILAHYYLCLCTIDEVRFSNEFAFISMWNEKRLPFDEKALIELLPARQAIYEDYRNRHSEMVSEKLSGHLTTEETKQKIADSAKGRYSGHIWINNGSVTKHVSKDDVQYYLDKGFSIGRNDLESNRKISESQKLNPNRSMLGRKQTEHQKETMRKLMLGSKASKEVRESMSKARQGKILISNKELKQSFYIYPQELDRYLSEGFYKGRLSK